MGSTREERALVIAATSKIRPYKTGFLVPSQSGRGTYMVSREGRCSCPDYQDRGLPCKHVLAVRLVLRRDGQDGLPLVTQTRRRATYPQNWPEYNAAQCEEKARFATLLGDLCATVPQPEYTRGRPPLPLADVVWASVYRVYDRISSRRFTSAMNDACKAGYLSVVPHFNSLTSYLRDPDLVPVLMRLITTSTKPFGAIEDTFAIDSSGFTSSRKSRWIGEKYGHPTKTALRK